MKKSVINSLDNFAVIPEWVLYAPVSSNAIRLYAVLRRFADQTTLTCYPSRRSISERCQFSSATVDRAMLELEAVGAVEIEHRKSPKGDWTSNFYTLKAVDPKRYTARDDTQTTGDDTGLITDDEQTIAISNESQITINDASTKVDAGKDLAKRWWEQQAVKPIGKRAFFALQNVCKAALDAGYAPDAILRALDQHGGVPSVAQLDRMLKGRNQPQSKRASNEQRLVDLHAQARAKAFAAAKGELT